MIQPITKIFVLQLGNRQFQYLTSIKDLPQGTALLPGDSSNAEEELPAVQGVGVLGEGPGGRVSGTDELLGLVDGDGLEAAVGDLADPEAGVGLLAVGQPRGTLVPANSQQFNNQHLMDTFPIM